MPILRLRYGRLTDRYVLALGDDAQSVKEVDCASVIERLPNDVLVETDAHSARALASAGEYVHAFSSLHDALRALALFRQAP